MLTQLFRNCHLSALPSLRPHLLPSLHLAKLAEAQDLAESKGSPSAVKIPFEINTSSMNCLSSVLTVAILSSGFSSSSATQEAEWPCLLTSLPSGTRLRCTLHLYLQNNQSLLASCDLALCFQETVIGNIHSDGTQMPAAACPWSTDQFYWRFLPQRDCHHSLK